MACIINLNNQLNPVPTEGAWIYLGYSTTSGTGLDPDGEDPNCFGITDPLDNGDVNNPYQEGPPANPIALTQNTFIPFVNPFDVDFDGVTPGFYGFLFINGDLDEDGIINGTECGDMTCFEIEVVTGGESMSKNGDLPSICESNLPMGAVDITALIDNYISGGEWTLSPDVSGIDYSDPTAVTADATTPVGVYTFTYDFDPEDIVSTHTVGPCAAGDCNFTDTFTLEITEALEAGVGMSLAVCN